MKIIILGAGRVGATLAKHLTLEDNDITLVDLHAERLSQIQERCDVRTVVGHGAYPQILEQAGIEDADLLIAVTNSDEVNMVACQLASKVFHTPTRIARIRAAQYTKAENVFSQDIIDVDLIISPEQLVSHTIKHVIDYPGTMEVFDFASGRVLLVVVRAEDGASLVGNPVTVLSHMLPSNTPKIIALYRHGQLFPVQPQTVIEAGDEVFFVTPSHLCREMIALLSVNLKPYHRIMIAGGGHIGTDLAQSLEQNHAIKLVEHNVGRTKTIANQLNKAIVLEGDAADKTLLLDENIEETDVFCAVTNDDEANIMASLLAKRLGVRKVMTLINRSSYVELIEESDIDVIISPEQATLSGFLRHIRKGDMVQVYTLRQGTAEAIEIIAHGNATESKVVGRKISEVALPKNAVICALVRENKVIMPNRDTLIEAEDHVIVFLPDANSIHEVERLFQVGLNFF